MAAHRDEPHASSRSVVDDSTTNRPRTGLAEAVTELRVLAQNPLLDGVESALAALGSAPSSSDISVEAVRRLQQWSTEHPRVAKDLEAAARCCRLVEREIAQLTDTLLGTGSKISTRSTGITGGHRR